jgi:hypothetical protein
MRQLSHVPQAHWSRTPGSPGAFAGKEFMAQLPHSRGAKRRENTPGERLPPQGASPSRPV